MKPRYLLPVALCLTLAACGEGQNARDILGLGRKAPDEFKVVSRPPLSVPPDFALRPPEEGADVPDLPPADLSARAMVTGSDTDLLEGDKQMMGDAATAVGVVSSYDLESNADQTFLDNIGAQKADADIRTQLNREQVAREAAVQEELDSAFGWLSPGKETTGTIVDAEKEKERLEENAESGKTVTEGETPSIEPRTLSPLEKLF